MLKEENLYDNFVGVYKVHIKAPKLEHPILPIKINGVSIYGEGKWIRSGVLFRIIKNAEKYGYKFNILGGYVFESHTLFNDYISELYTLKENSEKGSGMYLISKLLMNSLFGRMGIDTYLYIKKMV